MNEIRRLIFIHGLEGSSKGVKATLLRGLFPEMLVPDFGGSLEERMAQLSAILSDRSDWTIIGSSFGGLMGAMFTCRHPQQVRKQILLAPALIWPSFANTPPKTVSVPTVIYHGSRDEIIPLEPVKALAEKVFSRLIIHIVDDDHWLYETVHTIDWREVVGLPLVR